MFEFVHGQPQSVLRYLKDYFEGWTWCHAVHVLPMITLYPPRAWPQWSEDDLRDRRRVYHLVSSLDRWRAFRTCRVLAIDPRIALLDHLWPFIAAIQGMPTARNYLSEISENDIQPFAAELSALLRQFSVAVKGTASPVLASKAAHFLQLGLVPAYDRDVIRDSTLWWLAPRATDMKSYIHLCWWVLQRFKHEGTLEDARRLVAERMLARLSVYHPRRPDPDHWLLRSMDSVIAEYTLIGMARSVERRYLLRRTVRVLI
jgi:hypothetical protein